MRIQTCRECGETFESKYKRKFCEEHNTNRFFIKHMKADNPDAYEKRKKHNVKYIALHKEKFSEYSKQYSKEHYVRHPRARKPEKSPEEKKAYFRNRYLIQKADGRREKYNAKKRDWSNERKAETKQYNKDYYHSHKQLK